MDQPHLLFRQPNELSEGPVWDETNQALYWLDILAGTIWRSLWIGDHLSQPEAWSPSTRISSLGLGQKGIFVGAVDEGIVTFEWKGTPRVIAPPTFDQAKISFNDGKVGPDGAFWIGAKDREHKNGIASLEKVFGDGKREILARDLTISNGLDWSPDGRYFYLTDSIPRIIWRYRYHPTTGAITDREMFAGSEAPGVPDGLTVDAEGCLWVARWGGWQLVRLSPRGEVLTQITFPVSRVSSCILGGPDMKTLFVTTAQEGMSPAECQAQPLSGSVFSLRVDVPGLPTRRFSSPILKETP